MDPHLSPTPGPWGRATFAFQLGAFAIPATVAWTSSADDSIALPLALLPLALGVGLILMALPAWRSVGARVCAATVLAAVVEAGLVLALVAAYSAQHPGWDLS